MADFLPKVDIQWFLLTVCSVMQQHMVYRQVNLCQLSVCRLTFFADPCCAATFSDGLL